MDPGDRVRRGEGELLLLLLLLVMVAAAGVMVNQWQPGVGQVV